ncbi:RND superfamily putative drug exporter [Solirubrobacter pauli]|uniref:RND superfamily putative drug exporter n=1 Tax=Solirubrobacter pauli TaxID=166793 RepID=A0A660L1Q1_9ACTN|nr:MMPL family transporter [Solirubrobacter pauli]RKQ87235.1 RND superfamily putative drug exporter [Solirubrobacter pauli]
MSDVLARLARTLTHRWRRSLVVALAALVVLGAFAANGEPASDDFNVPGSESQMAVDLLKAHTPALAGADSQLVFTATDGKVSDPANRAAVESAIARVAKLDGVSGVVSPFDADGLISRDGTIAQTTVQYDLPPMEAEKADGERLLEAAESAERPGLEVSARGMIVDLASEQEAPVGELVGIGIAIILLTLLFRSLAAMTATLFGALVGVAFGQLVLTAVSGPLGLPAFAATIAIMLGLGAGIDYALLIIGRFREQVAAGDSVRDASAKALATSGSAVVTAGLIVMVAIAGLLVIGIPLIGKMGIGAAIGIAAVVVSAITLLPILIGAFSKRLAPKRYAHVAPSRPFARWGEIVTARPWLSVGAGVLVLLVLAFPVTQLRLGQPDDGNKPADTTQRVAYDQISQGFGAGVNGPLLITVDTPKGDAATAQQLERLRTAIAGTDGVVAAMPATPSQDGEIATLTAIPATAPQDERTSDLVDELRDRVIPGALAGTPLKAYVGGNTAGFQDFSEKTAAGLPVFIAVVIGLSVLLLMAAFRSIWIPLVSALFNLLSIAASYGIVVAVFQLGVGADLLGVGSDVPIVSFIPVMMFAILFGLSMDYNVFLLSRIHEAHNEGDSPRASVIHGVSRIGKVILYAGLIMGSVFLAFVTQPDVTAKMIGLGLGLGVLVDVLIVRLVIAPAVVQLLGARAWWLPRWLDRLLPNVSLEGHLVANRDPKRAPMAGHPDAVEEPVEPRVPVAV